MIQQYIITLDTALPADAAYALYAALLAALPAPQAQWLHDSENAALCQYLRGNRWYLSLLGRECVSQIAPSVDTMHTLTLHRLHRTVSCTDFEQRIVSGPEELLENSLPDAWTLRLQTPAAFKSAEQYQLLPTQQLILKSLIQKWNACFAEECPIEDEGGGMEALAAGLQYRQIQLTSQLYRMKGVQIPGTVGSIQISNHLTGFHRQLADALLQFGTYSGIGIKTRLGMGGMSLDWR